MSAARRDVPLDPDGPRPLREQRETPAVVRMCAAWAVTITWLLWAALLLGFLGRLSWACDLFANFRVQYLGLFAICAAALTLAKRRTMVLVAMAGVFVTTASMAPNFAEHAPAEPTAHHFRLLTFNVWFRNDDLVDVARYLERSDADLIVLQEVGAVRAEAIAMRLPSYPHRIVQADDPHGLMIMSRWPMVEVEDGSAQRIRRARRLLVEWRGTRISLLGAHLHWPLGGADAAARAQELMEIAELARRESGPLIVAGDLNLTPWSRYFSALLDDSLLRDCAAGWGVLPTWPAQFWPVRIRIDHCLVSRHWQVQRAAVGPDLNSDHLPLVIDLQLADPAG